MLLIHTTYPCFQLFNCSLMDSNLQSICSNCPLISHLDISCNVLTDTSVIQLAALKHLEVFCFVSGLLRMCHEILKCDYVIWCYILHHDHNSSVFPVEYRAATVEFCKFLLLSFFLTFIHIIMGMERQLIKQIKKTHVKYVSHIKRYNSQESHVVKLVFPFMP